MVGGCTILLALASRAHAMEGKVHWAWAGGLGGRVSFGVPGEVGLGVGAWGGQLLWNPDNHLVAGGLTAALTPGVYLSPGTKGTFSIDANVRASLFGAGAAAFAQGRFPLREGAVPGARFGLGFSGGIERMVLMEGRLGAGFDAGPQPRGVLFLELAVEGGYPLVVR